MQEVYTDLENRLEGVPLAIQILSKVLREDNEYYYGFQSSIAMSYIDNERWYREANNIKTLTTSDKHIIANNAAKYFLDLLISERKPKTEIEKN